MPSACTWKFEHLVYSFERDASPVVDATAFVLINSVKERLVHRELLRLRVLLHQLRWFRCSSVGLSPYSVGNLPDRQEMAHKRSTKV